MCRTLVVGEIDLVRGKRMCMQESFVRGEGYSCGGTLEILLMELGVQSIML